jgi:hypothetical protein
VILPTISLFLAAWLGGIVDAPAALPGAPLPVPAPPGLQQPPRGDANAPVATVVAGTGGVDASQVANVRAIVAAELPGLVKVFDGKPRQPFFVHVHGGRDALPDALAANLHADSPAFALLGVHQIHIVLGEVRRTGSRLASVVRHELVHELLDQYVAPNGRHVPRWFHEGLAQHLAGDTYLQASEDDLVLRIGTRRLEPFGALRARFPSDSLELRIAYAQSYSYVSWLVREYGLPALLAVARGADDLTPFDNVLAGRLGRPTVELQAAWEDYVLHGSGAPWRVVLDQCFSLCLIAFLPVLVLALMRRLDAERRTARRLADADAREAAVRAAAARAEAEALAAQHAAFDHPEIDAIPTEEEDAEAERQAARARESARGGHADGDGGTGAGRS